MQTTKANLVEILAKTTATSVKVTTFGEVKMNKTNNPFFEKVGRSMVAKNEVCKLVVCEYDFGGDYAEKVNEGLAADGSALAGTFKSSPLAWGEWHKGAEGRVIDHNGKMYVRCYINKENTAETTYYVDGAKATEEQIATIKEYLPTKSNESAKQSEYGLSVEKQVVPNNIDLDKIQSIEIDGVEYTL